MARQKSLPERTPSIAGDSPAPDRLRSKLPLSINLKIDELIHEVAHVPATRRAILPVTVAIDFDNPREYNEKINAHLTCDGIDALLNWAEAEITLPQKAQIAIAQTVVAVHSALLTRVYSRVFDGYDYMPSYKPRLNGIEHRASILFINASRHLNVRNRNSAHKAVADKLPTESPLVLITTENLDRNDATTIVIRNRLGYQHPAGTS